MFRIFFVLVFFLVLVLGTTDLNVRQIQFVADHLTAEECNLLMEALNRTSFQVNVNSLPHVNSTESCLSRLLSWNDRTKNETFQGLALRLREINRPGLADRLSEYVFHETAEAIRKNFLNDPFKKMIPKRSAMLDIPNTTEDFDEIPSLEPRNNSFYIASIVCGCLSVLILVCLAVFHWCPGFFTMMCERFAPVQLAVCCITSSDEVAYRCRRLKVHFRKHVIGEKHIAEDREVLI